jgi:hypothetical protein
MAGLTVGRVGLDVELGNPAEWRDNISQDGWDTIIAGYLRSSSMANTQALRKELLAQNGRLIALTYTLDDTLDGYYVQTSARVETIPVSFRGVGLFPFEVGLRRLGGESDVEFQSLITPLTLDNKYGLVDAEVKPFHAPALSAPLADAVYAVSGSVTKIARVSEDGTMNVYVFTGLPTSDISWSADPDDYYLGGCSLTVDGYVRAGLQIPNTPGSWQMSNGLVRVSPGGGGTSDGRLDVAHYDGSQWDAAKSWEVGTATGRVATWRYISCLRNDPEMVAIRLRVVATIVSATSWTLDLALRRGSRFVTGLLSYSGAQQDMKVVLETPESGGTSGMTPPGATGPMGVRASGNDAAGNRYVVGSVGNLTDYDTNGGITRGSPHQTQLMDFFIGSEVGGTGAAANDVAAQLCLQYAGWISETVRASRR